MNRNRDTNHLDTHQYFKPLDWQENIAPLIGYTKHKIILPDSMINKINIYTNHQRELYSQINKGFYSTRHLTNMSEEKSEFERVKTYKHAFYLQNNSLEEIFKTELLKDDIVLDWGCGIGQAIKDIRNLGHQPMGIALPSPVILNESKANIVQENIIALENRKKVKILLSCYGGLDYYPLRINDNNENLKFNNDIFPYLHMIHMTEQDGLIFSNKFQFSEKNISENKYISFLLKEGFIEHVFDQYSTNKSLFRSSVVRVKRHPSQNEIENILEM